LTAAYLLRRKVDEVAHSVEIVEAAEVVEGFGR